MDQQDTSNSASWSEFRTSRPGPRFLLFVVEEKGGGGKGEVRITDIIRVLVDGSEISVFKDAEPTGFNLDKASKWVIENRTTQPTLATFADPDDGRFSVVSLKDVAYEPLGPATATARQGPSAMVPGEHLPRPSAPGRFESAMVADSPGGPLPIDLPPGLRATVTLALTFPTQPRTDTIRCSLGPVVFPWTSSQASVRSAVNQPPPGRFGPPGIKKMKWLELRLLLDYSAALLKGQPPLGCDPGQPVTHDKWTTFLPGKDSKGHGTYIEPKGMPQATPLYAALVDSVAKKVFDIPIDLKQTTASVDWRLTGVTTWPGMATNRGEEPFGRQDVSFVVFTDKVMASSSFDVHCHSATMPLVVKDYAAEGTIGATLKLVRNRDGSTWPLPLTTERALPYDTDHDHLPDRWELDVTGAAGLPPSLTTLNATCDDDEDRFHRRLKNGDGLSAFEEYRGSFVQGKHARTDGLSDDTPVGTNSTVGDTNRGGPFRKDMFVHDPNKLFSTHGQLTTTYGASVHLITTDESFVPTLDKDKPFEGQINRMTPTTATASMDLRVPGINAQYRLKFVDTTTIEWAFAGEELLYRNSVPLQFNVTGIDGELRDRAKYALERGDAPYGTALQTTLVHELGHRYTLRHPVSRSTVTRVLASTAEPLSTSEDAAFHPDGRYLRARVITEERDLEPKYQTPGGTRFYSALHRPNRLMVGNDPTSWRAISVTVSELLT